MYHSEKPSTDDFHILGLKPGASPQAVRSSYKSLVKTWHPDRFPEGSPEKIEAEEKLKTINSAYRRIRSTWKLETAEDEQESPDTRREEKSDTLHGTDSVREPVRPSISPADLVWKWIKELKGAWATLHLYRRWLLGSIPILLAIYLINGLGSPGLHIRPKNYPPAISPPPTPDARQESMPRQPPPEPPSAPARSTPLEPPRGTPSTPSVGKPSHEPREEAGDGEAVFSLGSTQQEVFQIQGAPQKIHGQTWTYGLSSVGFKDGRVYRYSNFDGSLRVRVLPSTKPAGVPSPSSFSLHADKDRVLQVQGTPTRIEGDKWYYGFSEVHFKEGRVIGFNNFFDGLHVEMQPSKPINPSSVKGHFTVGSTMDEVLNLQGTPTSIQGNLWSYNLSSILFQDGRVRFANNLSGNLLFVPSNPGN